MKDNTIKPLVYCDIDGVILNFTDGIKKYLKQTKGVDFYPENITTYSFDGNIGCDRQLIFDCFDKPEVYELADLYEGIDKELMRKFAEYYDVHCYTTVVKNKEVYRRRYELCRSLSMVGYPFWQTRKPVLSDAENGRETILIEDCLGVIEDWYVSGSKATFYLIDRPYNRITEDNKNKEVWKRIIRVKSFADLAHKLIAQNTELKGESCNESGTVDAE